MIVSLFKFYLFLSCTIHPNCSLTSLYSSQSPPTSPFSQIQSSCFPSISILWYPSNSAQQEAKRLCTYSHMMAGQAIRQEEIGATSRCLTPNPIVRGPTKPQAKELQHVCRGPGADLCGFHGCSSSLCEPLWALLIWFSGPCSPGVLNSDPYNPDSPFTWISLSST